MTESEAIKELKPRMELCEAEGRRKAMTHGKYDFINVCNQVLKTKNLDMVERVHSSSFWIDLLNYLADSEVAEITGHNEPISYKPTDWSDSND